MHFETRNVNTAFTHLVNYFNEPTPPTIRRMPSRVGEVLMINEPVLITYTRPTERVLFNQGRDANPFFHLYEALWMLAGRNDVAPLSYYNSQIADIASDDGKKFNGAYGYRWRQALTDCWVNENEAGDWIVDQDYNRRIDQLNVLVEHLKANPNSRRAVLQMWNVEDDLLKIDCTKDVCCNTCIYFSIRQAEDQFKDDPMRDARPLDVTRYLDMTVCNRSNDMVWGMLGANYVHFTILQEYMAKRIGVEVGRYHQFSNNLHVYTERWEPQKYLDAEDSTLRSMHSPPRIDYADIGTSGRVRFDADDEEINNFVSFNSELPGVADTCSYNSDFINEVAQPMIYAFHNHKERRYHIALDHLSVVRDTAWRYVATEWIKKRKARYER